MSVGLRAIMVSVDYSDLLSVTLARNLRHFTEVMIVTDLDDRETVKVAESNRCRVFRTDLFYKDGAKFNKWRALEAALSEYGRHGWMCIMDADVIWPSGVKYLEALSHLYWTCSGYAGGVRQNVGQLFSPYRRIYTSLEFDDGGSLRIPDEKDWFRFDRHRNVAEWAGYTQVFHASDPHLPAPPWHQIDWEHAGGADSFFQKLWPRTHKIRPPWEVLHVGPPGENWYGRSTARLDGTRHEDADARQRAYLDIWKRRRDLRANGMDPYSTERVTFGPEGS